MSRVRTILTTVIPSMLAGGLLFGGAFGYAAARAGDDPWAGDDTVGGSHDPAPARTAQAPTPPPAPLPPRMPAPHPHGVGGGISVKIENGRVEIDGIDDMVLGQIDGVRDMLRSHPQLSDAARARALARLEKVRRTMSKRLAKIDGRNLDNLEEELEQMGEALEAEMEGLEDELEQLGDQIGRDLSRDLSKKFGKFPGKFRIDIDHPFARSPFDDDDDHDDVLDTVVIDDLGDDVDVSVHDLRDLSLQPAQREALRKIVSDSDRTIATAKQQLDELSQRLETVLADPRASDADIARYVDQISAQEATVRKARLLAWVNARRLLDDGQRARIERARTP